MTSAATANSPPVSVLRQELNRHAPAFRKALFFSLVINMMTMAPTFFMLEVYDRVVSSRNTTTLAMLLLLVVCVYVVIEIMDVLRGEIMRQIGLGVDASLRQRLFDSTFEATLKRGGGTAGTQMFNDLRSVRDFISSPAMTAIMDAPASLVFLAIVASINIRLGVMALFGAVVQVFIAIRTEKRTMPALTEANRAAIEAQSYATATLRNTQVIEAMGMMGAVRARWMGIQRRFLQLQGKASDVNGMNNATGKFIQTSQGSLILGASCWLSIEFGALGGGMMIVASTLGGRVLTPLVQLVAQWRLVVNSRDAYARLDGMLGALPPAQPAMALPPPKGRLGVEALTAAAPGTQIPILRGVTFAVPPGEVLVVIGPSACGKTTLARLLTGVWPAAAGKVRLDGADVYLWNKDELGPHVGYLPQGVELFDGTVAENIARFGNVDLEKVRRAAAMLRIDAWIESLPDGYDTRVGDDGAFLSGGQRQRIGLARAFYGMPAFVVLDEPNSSLDEAGEQALLDALMELKAAGGTAVVMSHRTSILPAADKMLVLRDGQVMLFGPRDEVMAALQKANQQAAQGQPPQAAAPGAAPAGRPAPPRLGPGPAPIGAGPGPRPAFPGAPVGGAA